MNPNPVSIIDIRIPFWRLVAFFIKASIAAIPAAIVVTMIFAIVYFLLAGMLFGMFGMSRI